MNKIQQRSLSALLVVCAVVFAGTAWADANSGDFLGYTLGTDYRGPAGSTEELGTNGTIRINAANPVKPDEIAEVHVIVTAESRTIGHITGATWFATEAQAREFARRYVNLLHAKYADWAFGREQMDINMRINEINLDNQPYNLRFRLDPQQRNGETQWRFSMTLSYLTASKEAQAWNNMANSQRLSVIGSEQKQILKNADLRGL